MDSVVTPRPDRALFFPDSMASLLRTLLVFSLCLTTAAVAREPDVTPEEVGLSSERLARFADYTNAMVESGKIPGATIAVARFGKLAYFETIGWADIDERKPTRADTLYRLHSMTKPLFAVATLALVEEGRLSLNEPISRYIPEFADVKVLAGGTADAPELEDPGSAPKVGQLLSQTAGIAIGGDLFAEKTIAEIYSRAPVTKTIQALKRSPGESRNCPSPASPERSSFTACLSMCSRGCWRSLPASRSMPSSRSDCWTPSVWKTPFSSFPKTSCIVSRIHTT